MALAPPPLEHPPRSAFGSPSDTPHVHRYAALAVLCVSMVVVALDNTILNVALPVLVRDLKATTSQLQWIVDAYATVFAGLLLVAGSLGDRIGRKKIFLGGLAVFASGSAASAFSGTVKELIASRAVMGVGAAAIMPSTLSILTAVFAEHEERQRAIGFWSAMTGLGVAIGPIAGGWLLTHFWWGSVFLVNVPIAVCGSVAGVVLIPESRDPNAHRADPTGGILSIAGLGLLLWAVIDSPTRGWHSLAVLAAGAAGIAVIAAMAAWELRSSHPMLSLQPFRNRRFAVAMSANALVIFALMGVLFVITQYLQFALGYSPLAAGIRILPVAAILGCTAPLSAFLDRFVGTKILVAFGMAMVVAGMWELSTTTAAETFGHALGGMLLLGAGTGFSFPLTTESVMGALPLDRVGVGSGTNGAAIQVGGALGVAAMGSVLSDRYAGVLAPLLASHPMPAAARAAILGSLGGAQAVARMAGGQMGHLLSAVATGAFDNGMRIALKVGAVVAGSGAILAALLLPAREKGGPRALPPDAAPPYGER